MAGYNAKKSLDIIRAWVRTTTYSAKKIADYFGVKKAIVEQMCLEERPWLKQNDH